MYNSNKNNFVILLCIAAVVIVGIILFVQPRQTPATRMENAMEEMGEGIDNASEELDPNRTPSEKLGDAVEDIGDDIQDATD